MIVYRCVTCGTIEEKMYARQVWKQCLNKKVIENKHTLRHFSKDELKDLFQLNDPQHSAMRSNIAVDCFDSFSSQELRLQVDLPENPSHMRFLQSLDIDGISEHSQLFTLDHDQIRKIVQSSLRNQIQNSDLKQLLHVNFVKKPALPHSPANPRTHLSENLNKGQYYFSSSDFPRFEEPSRSAFDGNRESSRRSRYSRPFYSRPHAENTVSPDWMFHHRQRAVSSSNGQSKWMESESMNGSRGNGGIAQRRKRFAPEQSMASKRTKLGTSEQETGAMIGGRTGEIQWGNSGMSDWRAMEGSGERNEPEIMEVESSSDSDVEVVAVRPPGDISVVEMRPLEDISVVDLASGSDSDVEEVG